MMASGEHLSIVDVARLSSTSVLVAGLGIGAPVAELLVRKGLGRLIVADAAGGHPSAEAVRKRLLEIDPRAAVAAASGKAAFRRLGELLERVDYAVDALEPAELQARIALHRAARERRKTVLSPCPAVNGAILWVFTPEGPGFESFFGGGARFGPGTAALRVLQRLVPSSPPAPHDLCRAVARGVRTPPADAVGVAQAAVLTAAAIENLALGRRERVIAVPRGLLVDVSEPGFGARVLEAPELNGGLRASSKP